MNQVILHWGALVITPLKMIGLAGAFLFSSRWFVQLYASRKNGKPTVPRSFWYLSVVGSFCTLSYFIFGKTDSVGILQNLFPAFIAVYNVYLDLTHQRREAA
jgi:lipid-A-disaccharide synthase-like uncharacterized protein